MPRDNWVALPIATKLYENVAEESLGRALAAEENANAEDVTGDPVTGGGRVIMAATDRELMLAAGARLVRFNGDVTETVADDDAPLASHVAQIGRASCRERV